jgi:hypothetical protein
MDFDNVEVESDDSSDTKFDIASLVLFQTNEEEGMCVCVASLAPFFVWKEGMCVWCVAVKKRDWRETDKTRDKP